MEAVFRLVAVSLALAAAPCWGLDVGTGQALELSGPIVDGDLEKIVAVLLKPRNWIPEELAAVPDADRHRVGPYQGAFEITINSPGGSVQEALRIAALVKALHVNVSVRPVRRQDQSKDVACASACLFVFLAGKTRRATDYDAEDIAFRKAHPEMGLGGYGYIGLHRPYFSAEALGSQTADASMANQRALMAKVREYLVGEQVSQRLIDIMMSRSSSDVYWMTRDDLNELGEYRPEYEELLIARCKVDSRELDRTLRAMHIGNRASRAQAEERYVQYLQCSRRLFTQVPALDRLAKGWRPKAFE